mmetsp:Transcript_20977/g.29019  ORF Transcript_20977/g.29019 Transcript_20977/m.29019 type:complete len:105 (-) Transcript_20977:1082-1396(-)
MLTLAIVHFIQFLFIKQLMKVQAPESEFKEVNDENDDNFARVKDDNGKAEKRFNYDYWWFWIVSFVVETIVLVLFFVTDGNELYFIFWIPTDAILFSCMFLYYI